MRYAEVERETLQTRVRVVLDLDKSGGSTNKPSAFQTGIGFLDHMLHQLAVHGHMELGIVCESDLSIDDHHTVKEVGMALGEALRQAIGEYPAIKRFGSQTIPLEDALVVIAVDMGGRGYVGFEAEFRRDKVGSLSTENVLEFLRALAFKAGMTIHVQRLAGTNDHHGVEAIFRGLGLALCDAISQVDRVNVNGSKRG